MKAFHSEFCLTVRLVKRPDLLTKFSAVQEHAFRRAVDIACHDPRYAEMCLPPRLEESPCPGTCQQCQAVVTTALNAATGGEAFDCGAFHRVMAKELTALGLERHKRSIDALAYRTKQLYSVATGLTGRSDRDKLVITENVCASFGRPSCGCTLEEVDANGAGKQIVPSGSGSGAAVSMIVGEGEHVSTDAVKSAELAAGGDASVDTLKSEAEGKKSTVDALVAKEKELKAQIVHEENQEHELEAAAGQAEHNPVTAAEHSGSGRDATDAAISKDEEKLNQAEEKLHEAENHK